MRRHRIGVQGSSGSAAVLPQKDDWMDGNIHQLPGETPEGRAHVFLGCTSVRNLEGGDETRKSFAFCATGEDPAGHP